MAAERVVVLVVASGASWESAALAVLAEHPGVVVLKRCVDVDDLLAAASSGQAGAAVLGAESPGLDAAAVAHLRRHGVRPVAVVVDADLDAARVRADRVGLPTLVPASRLDTLPQVLTSPEAGPTRPSAAVPVPDLAEPAQGTPSAFPGGSEVPASAGSPGGAGPALPGRVVAVWGPTGSPGRSTVAAAVGAELAARGRRTTLVDADPMGGSLGQQLGVLDEVSGLLAAGRLAGAGRLEERVATVQRALDSRLSVVTGLPRPDRWSEVRPGVLEELLAHLSASADVVVDTGGVLEDDPHADLSGRPARHGLTLAALEAADDVLVVGTPDPVGLTRLARGLVDLRDRLPATPVHVVVNRMRPTLGWTEQEVTRMVSGFARVERVHVLPDDRPATDRALVSGRTLLEGGESPLTRAVAGVVDTALAVPPRSGGRGRGVRRRRAGTARRW